MGADGSLQGGNLTEVIAQAGRRATEKTVRIIYLVPADKQENPNYTKSLTEAVKHLQIWYRNQLGNGKTFQLHDTPVEVYKTPHNALWYSQNPNGDLFVQFWNNVLADGFPLTNGKFNDPDHIYAYYIDADPACGQCGGCGTSGVLVISANDLRGLTGGE
ncbi:hypothetical protein [Rufibacter psychrotolerans]|uniref:hypothetical protein n=1 Tax=Rufibacter psychrotolerans TaxID=2812556 RepID=UPI00196818DE|nr:hypothetical protein [Rufibacter sp. SYSU D00308]